MTELEQSLVALGRDLVVPATPDLASAVIPELPQRARPQSRRRLVLAVAFVLVAVVAATLAIPDARSALFRVLHIGDEEIELVDELPQVPAQPDLRSALGRRVSLAMAQREAGFRLRRLDEPPDRVYLGDRGTVWFLYGTPARVRLLLAQTRRLRVDPPLLFKKVAQGDTRVEEVSVDGSEGVFLSGGPHVLLLLDRYGQVVEESSRLARDVLVWSEGGVAYRLEGDLSKSEALRLARSLR
jgi:hypothetical protein